MMHNVCVNYIVCLNPEVLPFYRCPLITAAKKRTKIQPLLHPKNAKNISGKKIIYGYMEMIIRASWKPQVLRLKKINWLYSWVIKPNVTAYKKRKFCT